MRSNRSLASQRCDAYSIRLKSIIYRAQSPTLTYAWIEEKLEVRKEKKKTFKKDGKQRSANNTDRNISPRRKKRWPPSRLCKYKRLSIYRYVDTSGWLPH